MISLDYSIRDRIAVIAFASPPVNSLSFDLRVALVASLERAKSDTDVDAVVLIGSNDTFCAGADIKEFGTPAMLVMLPQARPLAPKFAQRMLSLGDWPFTVVFQPM